MSLQVWLPLTKDLRNQGVGDVTVTNNGATYSSTGGKLGGTYYFDGNKQWFQLSESFGDFYNNDWSCAVWLKPTDSTRSVIISEYGGTGASNVAIELTASRVVRVYWAGSPDVTFTTAGALALDAWTHVVVCKSSGQLQLYLNGSLAQTYTGTLASHTSNCQPRIGDDYRGNSANTVSYQGYMNDFRLYDHCLSPMEVKQLSKGLVLHYPLNRQGWGQENLVWNSNWNLHSTTPPENWTNWGSPPTREVITINGKNWLHVISNTTTFQGYSQNWTKRNGVGEISENTKLTVSFTAYLATAATIAPIGIHWCNSSGTIVTQNWTTTALTTTPQRYSFTYTTPSGCVGFNIMVGDNTNAAHEVWITDIKLEKGSIATPWCPNSADTLYTTMGLNGTTEYDTSGYCNNGSKMTTTLTYSSDTSKYNVSTYFNGTYDGILIENLTLSDIINSAVTYAFWIKPDGESGARSVYFGSYSGVSWSIEKTTGNVLRLYWNGSPDETCTGATITDGVWQHVCITKSGTSDIKVYINGVQKWSSTATHSSLTFPTTYGIGRDSRSNDGTPYKGYMSDFRIYATALSAEDVANLYSVSSAIDSNGNVYSAAYIES